MPLDIPLDAGAMMQIMWLVLLIVFAASEAITVGLTSIWFAAGALAALVAALLGGAVWIQITLFLAVSLLCLAAVRPLAKRHLNSKVEPTNADRVIGAQAQVTEDIDNEGPTGAVYVDGGDRPPPRQGGGDHPGDGLVRPEPGWERDPRRDHGARAAHRGGEGVRGAHRRPGVRRGTSKLVSKDPIHIF